MRGRNSTTTLSPRGIEANVARMQWLARKFGPVRATRMPTSDRGLDALLSNADVGARSLSSQWYADAA